MKNRGINPSRCTETGIHEYQGNRAQAVYGQFVKDKDSPFWKILQIIPFDAYSDRQSSLLLFSSVWSAFILSPCRQQKAKGRLGAHPHVFSFI